MLQLKNQSMSLHHQVLWLPTAHPRMCVRVFVLGKNGVLWPFTLYWKKTQDFLTLAPSLFNTASLSIFLSVYPSPICCLLLSPLFSDFLYVYVCLYIWMCVHSCVCLHMPVFLCVCLCIPVYVLVHMCVCMCVCVCVCAGVHVCVWVCVFLLSGQVRRSCRMMSSPVTFSASCSCSVKDTTQVCVCVCKFSGLSEDNVCLQPTPPIPHKEYVITDWKFILHVSINPLINASKGQPFVNNLMVCSDQMQNEFLSCVTHMGLIVGSIFIHVTCTSVCLHQTARTL